MSRLPPPLVAMLSCDRKARGRVAELGKANKWDLELLRAERWRLLIEKGGDVAAVVLAIAAMSLPLLAAAEIIKPLAGEKTVADINIDIAITVSLTVALSLSVALNAGLWVRGRARKRELKRQRKRMSELEHRLGLRNEKA